jgi:hypothetical protein
VGNKTKPNQSKLRLDTPEVTPRGKPPIGGHTSVPGYTHGTPFGRNSHAGLFTPAGPSPGFMSLQPPATPQGKNLLQKTLANMNLPSEDWVDEMKELNGQLIEWSVFSVSHSLSTFSIFSLEQLFERESELQQQRGEISQPLLPAQLEFNPHNRSRGESGGLFGGNEAADYRFVC